MNDVTLLYTHSMSIGYGRMGVKLADALTDLGVNLYDSLGAAPENERESATIGFEDGPRRPPSAPTNVVSWVSVPSHARWWYDKQYASCFTMWEASVLPPSFRDTLHEFDLLMVPSKQNLELFGQYHDNVKMIPLGVDLDKWHYSPRVMPDKYFNFLCGGSGKRKGVDVAFKAFRTVFKGWKKKWGPEPQLILKNPKGEAQFRGYDRVQMVSGHISNEAEIDLYAMAHCYVQPSRGEGFGLQPLQAMAQGLPTILTDAHGHSAFAQYGIPLGWDWSKAEYFIYGDAGDWWEPDFEHLCELMWDVYQNYEGHVERAAVVAQTVIPQEFSWVRCAERFVEAHEGQLTVPYRGSGDYYFPVQKRFQVRVTKAWDAEIAGLRYMWLPGKDYWEPADVKRILFERGVLDPTCFEGGDHGLVPQQVERLGEYSAQQEWCPTCRQQLNTRRTLADTLYEEMERQAHGWS